MRWKQVTKKRGSRCFTSDSLLGGGYLRLPVPQDIGVVTLRALCQERDKVGTGDKKTREPLFYQ